MCIRDRFWDNAMGDESNEFHREVVRPKVTELLSPNPADYILAVSYTHLDVYKRQVMIGGHESFLFNEDEKWFVEAKEQCL